MSDTNTEPWNWEPQAPWRKFSSLDTREQLNGLLVGVLVCDTDGDVYTEFGYIDDAKDDTFAIKQAAHNSGVLRFWFSKDVYVMTEDDMSTVMTDLI